MAALSWSAMFECVKFVVCVSREVVQLTSLLHARRKAKESSELRVSVHNGWWNCRGSNVVDRSYGLYYLVTALQTHVVSSSWSQATGQG